MLSQMIQIMKKEDLLLFEINPFIFTKDGKNFVLDARMNFDESALFRHPEYSSFLSLTENMDSNEIKAKDADIAFVKLNGNIGMISCGAGLSMATCDMISHYGGAAANFLDVGGGATPEKVEAALDIIFGLNQIKGVLINVFGGITRGDQVAQGVISSLNHHPSHVPVVVRLIGTNDIEGVKILSEHGLNAYTEMEPAVKKILELVNKSE